MSLARRVPRTEVKYNSIHVFDNTLADEARSVNLAFTNLGVQPNQRVGRLTQGVSLAYNMEVFTTNGTNPDVLNNVRVVFIRWQDDNPPQLLEVIHNMSVDGPYNYAHQAKWKILSDKTYDLNHLTIAPGNPPTRYPRQVKTVQAIIQTKWRCEYDRDEDDQDRGSIYCFLLSGVESNIRVNMWSTFAFTDM